MTVGEQHCPLRNDLECRLSAWPLQLIIAPFKSLLSIFQVEPLRRAEVNTTRFSVEAAPAQPCNFRDIGHEDMECQEG